jgi:hypothetical protein
MTDHEGSVERLAMMVDGQIVWHKFHMPRVPPNQPASDVDVDMSAAEAGDDDSLFKER